jgi:hypothetical protein
MATLHKEVFIEVSIEHVWDAIRDLGALHTRLVPGFVLDTRLDGEARIVTFADGSTLREPIISLDDERRRLAWAAEGNGIRHYNAVLQVTSVGAGTRVVWTSDLLPHELAGPIGAMQDQGLEAMKRALEGGAAGR